jgi:hypothetical protein
LYESQELSLGQAADAAGLPKRAFAELLGSYGYVVLEDPDGDLFCEVKK